MLRAFTRAVSPRLAECELTHLQRTPIDVAKAVEQHATYEHSLSKAGFEVVRLPELPDKPDAVFVEDTALLLDADAIILRPGAASRAEETTATAQGLASHFTLHSAARGHIDGGDILRIGKQLYVGLSTRTNADGIEELTGLGNRLGFDVAAIGLRNCLHLKTGATFVGRDGSGTPVLLYDESSVDPQQFVGVEPVAVASGERAAANCVRAGHCLILPAGNPQTAAALDARGFEVIEVDVSELQKAEAGVTCMSLIDERP